MSSIKYFTISKKTKKPNIFTHETVRNSCPKGKSGYLDLCSAFCLGLSLPGVLKHRRSNKELLLCFLSFLHLWGQQSLNLLSKRKENVLRRTEPHTLVPIESGPHSSTPTGPPSWGLFVSMGVTTPSIKEPKFYCGISMLFIICVTVATGNMGRDSFQF